MENSLRKSGIDIVGEVSWGTHFCQFYQTKQDLIDILVPYFKAGLENNEFCMWVTSEPLGVEEAKEALRKDIPGIDVYLEKGQIEIIPYTYWYVKEGIFDSQRVLNGWIDKLNRALADGYNGLRLSGNTFWLEKTYWSSFVDYEEEIDSIIGNYSMIALCTYCLARCSATEIIDVVTNYQFALVKKEEKWVQIESSRLKEAEKTAIQATKNWEHTFDSVPDLIAIIDEEYRVVRANRAMAERLGVTPEECVGLKCYRAIHGTNEPPSFCPHRQLLADGREHITEVHEDSLGGDFIVSVSPIHDSDEKIVGSIHVARNITERKRAELEREITVEFLRLVNESRSTSELVHSSVKFFRERSGFEAVGIRLKEGEDYPYFETSGFPEEFVRLENSLCKRDVIGRPIRDSNGYTIRECMCGNVIHGRFDPSKSFFTKKGSFCTNSTTELLVTTTDADHQVNSCNRCNSEGYESVALIALRVGGECLGLLQLNDRRKGQFSPETILLWERLAEYLAIAIAKTRAEDALLEAYESLQVQSEELEAQTEDLQEAYEALSESKKRFELLSEANALLLSSKEPETTIQIIAEKVMRHLNCDVFFNYVFDEAEGRLHLNAYGGTSAESAKEIEWLDKGAAICGCVARDGYRIVSEDVQHNGDKRADLVRSMGIQAYSCQPLHIGEKTMGTLSFGTTSRKGFTEDELALMSVVADQVSVAIERKRTERTLRESEARRKVAETMQAERERLNSVLDMLPAYVILLSPDYRVPFANRFFEERFGKSEGRRCYEYLFQRTEPCENCETYKVFKTGAPHHWEWTGPDGRNYDVYDYPFKDSDGSTLIMEVGIDITEIKKAQAVAQAERQRLFDVLETLPAMICLLTPDYHVAFANRGFREKFGESGGLHCYEYCYECTRPCEFCEIYKVLETGQPHHWEGNTPDGRIIDSYDFPFTDIDGSPMILKMDIDVTEQKRAEAELKKRREQLENAYNSLKESERSLSEAQRMAHLGNWNWNIVTNELYWSDEIYRIFGRSPQEFGATYDAFLEYIHPEDRDYVNRAVKEAFNGKNYSVNHRIILASGEERIVHEQAEVIFNEENIPVHMRGTVQDITEQKMAEKALELANAYNRSLIEASIDPFLTIGPDGKITDVNNSTEFVTGYSRKELIGTDFSDYFTEPEKAREGYQHVFQKGLLRNYPLEVKHKNGRITPVLYNASVYRDETGEVIGVFAAARDISEQKKAEEKIRILASAVESSDDAIVTESLDGIITSWNKGAEQIYGYFAEEILGKNISILEPDNRKGEIKQLVKKIQEEERIQHYETSRLRKDRTLIDISVTLSPVLDVSGQLIAVSIIARDITERKKAEEALRLSSIYNRSLIEASLDPLVTIGPDGKITDVNKATELVTGYSRSELIGTDFSDYFTEPEKAREGYQHAFREGLVLDYGLEIQHRNGHVTPVLYNASIYKDETGEVIGVFAAARDITERKKAEKLLKLKLEELARSNAELEQFAYVSSHDLQEPLRMIASYLQLLQRKYQGKLDEKADKYIYFAVDGASRMQNLINDLLEFSRVTTKAREFEPTDLQSVLDRVLFDLDVSITENEASISYGSLPVVLADSVQFTQLFQNLISNAIKFRSEKTPKIEISAKKETDQWLFSVKDNGIGIDPKYSERIFEVFKRLHKREEYPGTGIGLSICKKIIERHGGQIWVESEPDKGSTFYFTLPVIPINVS